MIASTPRGRSSRAVPRWVAPAALFGVAGVGHFLRPRGFDAIVPRVLPGTPRFWTLASGAAELGLAAGYAVPATRRVTSRVAAAFLVAVWPANVQMAVDAWRSGTPRARAVTTVRLPLQAPLVRLALRGGA